MATRTEPKKLQINNASELTIGIVQAEFNDDITNAQYEEAVRCLEEYGIAHERVTVAGAYEIPYAVGQMAQTKKYNGIVTLGCLIKGGTIHFEVIAYSLGREIMRLTHDHNLPIGFGVLTTNTHEQAIERTYIGYDATHAILDLLSKEY